MMTSDTILRPPPLTVLRRAVARGVRDPDTRSVLIGLAGVVLIHLLLWLLGPAVLRFEAVPVTARPESTERNFSIELEPEVQVQPQPKPAAPFRFVETNPEAPENVPDKTNNFAAQNQQVAQQKPTPEGRSDRPALEGRTDIESTQIVSGRLTQPQEFTAAPPLPAEAPPSPEVVPAPRRDRIPFPVAKRSRATTARATVAVSPSAWIALSQCRNAWRAPTRGRGRPPSPPRAPRSIRSGRRPGRNW